MRAKVHPGEEPRGVRDPRSCKAQAGGKLVWIQDGVPMFWSDRPFKFPGHIALMMTKRGGTVIEDVKWKQLNGRCWWRLPQVPTGRGEIAAGESERYRGEFARRRRRLVRGWDAWFRGWVDGTAEGGA